MIMVVVVALVGYLTLVQKENLKSTLHRGFTISTKTKAAITTTPPPTLTRTANLIAGPDATLLAAATAQAAREIKQRQGAEERLPQALRAKQVFAEGSEIFEASGPLEFGPEFGGGCVIKAETDDIDGGVPLPGQGEANPQPDPRSCCHSCMRHPHCKAFVHETDTLSCTLLQSTTSSAMQPHPLRTAGLALNPAEASAFVAKKATDAAGVRLAGLASEKSEKTRVQEILLFPA